MTRRILVVGAHPDDEALGCGAAMARWSDEGCEVETLFLTDGVSARGNNDGAERRAEALHRASNRLGVTAHACLEFPDNELDSVPLLRIVKAIEQHVNRFQPVSVVTHHARDLNIDHRICHEAVLTACRPQPGHRVKRLLCFETLSSTEWRASQRDAFSPNYFVDVTKHMSRKYDALEAYAEEMREAPHARSTRTVEALAVYRGASVGVAYAEAFELVRGIE